MCMKGAGGNIFAIGDCTATSYAPTAQVASQQGAYLARILHQMAKRDALVEKVTKLERIGAALGTTAEATAEEKARVNEETEEARRQLAKIKLRPFHYSHQGSLAYIGSDKAIADLPFMNGNVRCFSLYLFEARADMFFLVAVRERRCRDVPLLAQCVPQHAVLAAQPHARRHRLGEG